MAESTPKLSKKQEALRWLNAQSGPCLKCLHCQDPLQLEEDSLLCENGHRFDLAKQGYLFLAHKAYTTKYDQALFEARRQVITESGLYGQLHEFLIQKILDHLVMQKISHAQIVDAGSGEGSHLFLLGRLLEESLKSVELIGLDLSKAGIQMATSYNDKQLNLVADLSQIPLLDHQTDVILSILSPSNYEEFQRILKKEGLVLKVVPNPGYLQEIRRGLEAMGIKGREDYSNQDVIEVFDKHYPRAHHIRIQDQVIFSKEDLACLIKMTPLTWHLEANQLEELLERLTSTITLDVTVLVNQ